MIEVTQTEAEEWLANTKQVMTDLKKAYEAWAWSERCRESKKAQAERWAAVRTLSKQLRSLEKQMFAVDKEVFTANLIATGTEYLIRK